MLPLSKNYPNKTAFITGAASGIGLSIALMLAKDGWRIGITDINSQKLAEATKLIQAIGGQAIPFIFDVSDRNAYKLAVDNFMQQTKHIDVLINNAGVGDGAGFEEYTLENWDWLLGINQMGVIYGCYYFIPYFKQQNNGYIINIASAAAFAQAPRMAAYNVAKAGVLAISETLYAELKEHNINVSVVMPTFINTSIMQYARGNNQEEKELGNFLVQSSKITPDYLAEKILQQAGKKQFYIIEPFQSRFLFNIKRLFPMLFMHTKTYIYNNKRNAIKKRLLNNLSKK